jgi:hypothetical protein
MTTKKPNDTANIVLLTIVHSVWFGLPVTLGLGLSPLWIPIFGGAMASVQWFGQQSEKRHAEVLEAIGEMKDELKKEIWNSRP